MSVVSLNQYQGGRGAVAEPGSRRQLEVVAEQFEALFLQQILKQMRKAGDVLGADNPLRGRDSDTLRDFHDEALAESLAGRRQTGIADMLVQQLSGGAPTDFADAARRARDAQLPHGAFAGGLRGSGLHESGAAGALRHSAPRYSREAFGDLVSRVIDQESSGNVAAVSHKGALGLMQLMPDTAREMAAKQGVAFDEARLTRDAAYNRRLGSAYLGEMLERYDGHQALALAAYNAGPGRVDEWLQAHGDPRSGELSTEQWLERVPYAETRDYARRILGLESAEPSAALKSQDATVAQMQSARERLAESTHRSRSAAFAQPIRLER